MRMLCTWSTTCLGPAVNRMVQENKRGGSVEFVCDHHVVACQSSGYSHAGRTSSTTPRQHDHPTTVRQPPPVVPPEFWETADMRLALDSRHMGKIIRAYRQHPYHGYGGITQDEVARWAGISQGQVSRLENGEPLLRLDQLIHWSLLLGIPPHYLWFDLPDGDDPATWPGRRRTAPATRPA